MVTFSLTQGDTNYLEDYETLNNQGYYLQIILQLNHKQINKQNKKAEKSHTLIMETQTKS